MIPLFRQEVMLLLGEGDFLVYLHISFWHYWADISLTIFFCEEAAVELFVVYKGKHAFLKYEPPEPFRDGFQAFLFSDDLHDLRRLQHLTR